MSSSAQGDSALQGRTIIVGVSGGIAAYKSADLVSKLVQGGFDVQVVMTAAATHFVGVAGAAVNDAIDEEGWRSRYARRATSREI